MENIIFYIGLIICSSIGTMISIWTYFFFSNNQDYTIAINRINGKRILDMRLKDRYPKYDKVLSEEAVEIILDAMSEFAELSNLHRKEDAALWYTETEINDFLRSKNYSEEISNELSKLYSEHMQYAFDKGKAKTIVTARNLFDRS